ncbi:MAG: hypothetical protein ACOYJY_05340 [Acutalibacteraceae bacterium]|jgi:hypothetical protein
MPENKHTHGCRDAVCIDAGRVFDSCGDRDCLEDLRVCFTERDQALVDDALNLRARDVEVLTVYIDVEPIPFNKGYYACDLTFYFHVRMDVYTGRSSAGGSVNGLAVFRKRVILYGGEGNVKVFSSEYRPDGNDPQRTPTRNLPRCNVQVAEPVVLDYRVTDCGEITVNEEFDLEYNNVPGGVAEHFDGTLQFGGDHRRVYVTVGVFTIVQLIRNVQMLMPAYDYCMPTKECTPQNESACDLFRQMSFPVDEFFPPRVEQNGAQPGGSASPNRCS